MVQCVKMNILVKENICIVFCNNTWRHRQTIRINCHGQKPVIFWLPFRRNIMLQFLSTHPTSLKRKLSPSHQTQPLGTTCNPSEKYGFYWNFEGQMPCWPCFSFDSQGVNSVPHSSRQGICGFGQDLSRQLSCLTTRSFSSHVFINVFFCSSVKVNARGNIT